jgi:L-rhamnose mutarotase
MDTNELSYICKILKEVGITTYSFYDLDKARALCSMLKVQNDTVAVESAINAGGMVTGNQWKFIATLYLRNFSPLRH